MSENRLTKFPEILFKEDNIYIYIFETLTSFDAEIK